MNLRTLVADDDAVSPVIGVILMVAVTVILAAVIGAFVLGIGSQVTESTPSVTLGFDYDDSGNGFGSGDSDDQITITHDGGDGVDPADLSATVGGTSVSSSSNSGSWSPPSGDFTAGTTITIDESAFEFQSGQGVLLIFESDGGSTAILGESEVPS